MVSKMKRRTADQKAIHEVMCGYAESQHSGKWEHVGIVIHARNDPEPRVLIARADKAENLPRVTAEQVKRAAREYADQFCDEWITISIVVNLGIGKPAEMLLVWN